MRPLRFGFQLTGVHEDDPVAAARRAEEVGFDVVLVSDHVGPGPAPLPTLAAIAAVTERIRLGTLVLNNDMRNPVQLAWEAVTIDRLSAGRFELGLGAGHTPQEYAASGLTMLPASSRKERLIEGMQLIRRLLDGETVDADDVHYSVSGATVDRSMQARLPILVGGNGARLLGAAGEHADIVGLQGLGRTHDDGHRHDVRWTVDHLDAQIDQVRVGAGSRFAHIELNALVQVFEITDDRDGVLAKVCERIGGLSLDDARSTPYLMVGTVDEIAAHARACADRWGVTYFVVRDLDAFARVLDALR